MIEPIVALARRFTVDWLDRADTSVLPSIMSPDYRIHIGGVDMAGLDAYTEATAGQLARFPGLTLTIHDLITDGDRLALVFTEHGASVRDDLRPAAWSGVALFRWDGARLTENWTEEDYYARRRQLTGGAADVIAAPAPAPWTTRAVPGDPGTLEVAHRWLAAPDLAGVFLDDGRGARPVLDVHGFDLRECFAAGARVAFAGTWHGTYRGGLAGVADGGVPASLDVAGVVTVADGAVTAGRIVTDRLGLRRTLLAAR